MIYIQNLISTNFIFSTYTNFIKNDKNFFYNIQKTYIFLKINLKFSTSNDLRLKTYLAHAKFFAIFKTDFIIYYTVILLFIIYTFILVLLYTFNFLLFIPNIFYSVYIYFYFSTYFSIYYIDILLIYSQIVIFLVFINMCVIYTKYKIYTFII